jgi:uncharacterized protein YecT (DUF1311 family)
MPKKEPAMIRHLAALFLLSLPASAQEVNCANAVTQQEMNICQHDVWAESDERLNGVYAETIAILRQSDVDYPIDGPSEEERLRNAQRAWVAFRDANCDSAGYSMRGGSAEPLLVFGCMHQMTEARIEELTLLTQGF